MALLKIYDMRKLLRLSYLLVLICLSVSSGKVFSQYNIPEKMDWWYNACFGMFIHFGSYSYLGHSEWAFYTENWTKADYQTEVSANFDPENFNAETIVSLAKNAGMKYLVITAKHHEGFAMWHAAVESFIDVTGNCITCMTLRSLNAIFSRNLRMNVITRVLNSVCITLYSTGTIRRKRLPITFRSYRQWMPEQIISTT
jgi:hypothetical protein